MLNRIALCAVVLCCLANGCDDEDQPVASQAPAGTGAPQIDGGPSLRQFPPPEQAEPQADQGKRWSQPPEMQIDTSKTYFATIKTNLGDIRVELFDDAAPKTVNNFVFLAQSDFYDGTIFHRVINEFMIQGGDPTGTGTGDPGYKFQDEIIGNPHKHEPLTLSMANAGPNTNGSQFFITEVPTPHLDGKHTVFGRVVEGQDVVEKISDVETGSRDRPVEDVVIQDVVIDDSAPGEEPATQPEAEQQPSTRPAADE